MIRKPLVLSILLIFAFSLDAQSLILNGNEFQVDADGRMTALVAPSSNELNLEGIELPDWVNVKTRQSGKANASAFLQETYQLRNPDPEKYPRQLSLKIRVVDYTDGAPLQGALVTDSFGHFVFTDKDGMADFHVGVREKDFQVKTRVVHPDYFTAGALRRMVVSAENGAKLNVALVPSPLIEVAGTVKGEGIYVPAGTVVSVFYGDGEDGWRWVNSQNEEIPYQGNEPATVKFDGVTYRVGKSSDSLLMLADSSTTLREGQNSFRFPMCPPSGYEGNYRVVASYPNTGFAETVTDQEGLKNLSLSLKPEGGITVAGVVFDDEGNPKADVALYDEYSRLTSRTDAEGRFRFEHVELPAFYLDFKTVNALGERPDSFYLGSPTYMGQDPADLKIHLNTENARAVQMESGSGMWGPEGVRMRLMSALAAGSEDARTLAELNAFYQTTQPALASVLLAVAAQQAGDLQSASDWLAEAKRLSPTDQTVLLLEGWLYLTAGQDQKALEAFQKLCQLQPDHLYGSLGQVLAGAEPALLEKPYQKLRGQWPAPVMEVWLGKRSVADLYPEDDSNPVEAVEAAVYRAWKLNQDGKTEQAIKELDGVPASGGRVLESFFVSALKNSWAGDARALPSPQIDVEEIAVPLPMDSWKETQKGAVLEIGSVPENSGYQPRSAVLHLKSGPEGFVYTSKGHLPENLESMSEFSFWVYRKPGLPGSSTVDVNFYVEGGKTNFWRKVTLDHQGWEKVTVPLAWMRWSKSGTRQWNQVRQMGIYCRDNIDVLLTDFEFTRRPGETAAPDVEQLKRLAFPDPDSEGLAVEKNRIVLLTDETGAVPQEIFDWVNRHLDLMLTEFPFLKAEPLRKPILVVFDERKDYQAFPPRFAQMHNSEGVVPSSGGYTFMGMATSFWSEEYGAERPVYGHEFLHAYLELAIGLPSGSGDWVQEGLANYVQIEVTPQQDLADIVLAGIGNPSGHLPLKDLCSGKDIPMDRYWQALTFIGFLKANHSDKLPALFEAIVETRITDLNKHLAILETDWPTLTEAWKSYCRETYK